MLEVKTKVYSIDSFKPEEHFEYSDPQRIKAVFADIEYYKRGKLSGEALQRYMTLLEKHNTGEVLSKVEGQELHQIIAESFSPVFKTDGYKTRCL